MISEFVWFEMNWYKGNEFVLFVVFVEYWIGRMFEEELVYRCWVVFRGRWYCLMFEHM